MRDLRAATRVILIPMHGETRKEGRTMLKHIISIAFILFVTVSVCNSTSDETLKKRKGKLFPIFQVVTFPNTVCTGTGSKNGTCYTAAECTSKGGVAAGSCAQSYGVCCIFSVGCGTTISQNCTYFESTGTSAGACSVKICKCSPTICQLRLDFNSFVIAGPSSVTSSIAKEVNGVLASMGKSVSPISECLTDTFSVTSPGGSAPPVICGTNTGQHMYVDASDSCNNLAFQLGATAVGTSATQRTWSIKVTQLDCSSCNLAPPGCTQYYYGSTTGTVQTYNFDGAQHLANQNQNICVRAERGNCRICWTQATALTDFQVGLVTAKKQSSCCQYGNSGMGMGAKGGDCATFPGALRSTLLKRGASRVCGSAGLSALNAAGMAGVVSKSVCSDSIPFSVRFLSDNFEMTTTEAAKNQNGFKLLYTQNSASC